MGASSFLPEDGNTSNFRNAVIISLHLWKKGTMEAIQKTRWREREGEREKEQFVSLLFLANRVIVFRNNP